MHIRSLLSVFTLAQAATAITQHDATAAFNQLQTWYNSSIGLWIPSTGWWNSANCLTTIADLAQINPTVAAEAEDIYHTTFVRAQKYNLQLQKELTPSLLIRSNYKAGPKRRPGGFLNNYYDDEGKQQPQAIADRV
jgi:hypothetical protein